MLRRLWSLTRWLLHIIYTTYTQSTLISKSWGFIFKHVGRIRKFWWQLLFTIHIGGKLRIIVIESPLRAILTLSRSLMWVWTEIGPLLLVLVTVGRLICNVYSPVILRLLILPCYLNISNSSLRRLLLVIESLLFAHRTILLGKILCVALDQFHGALIISRFMIVVVLLDVLNLASPTHKLSFLLILRLRLLIITRWQRSFSSRCSLHCHLFDSLDVIFLLVHLHYLISVVVRLLIVYRFWSLTVAATLTIRIYPLLRLMNQLCHVSILHFQN